MQELTPEWVFALICIFCGCLCLTTTLGLIIFTQWDRTLEQYARWSGFLAGKMDYFIKPYFLFMLCFL